MEFTLNEALAFYENGKLEDWIQNFLRAELGDMPNPNFALADGLLLEEREYFFPVCIPLEDMKTIRIEKDILDENELRHYNYKVEKIIDKLQDWDIPPLIVQFDGGEFVLTDGNHRYSALKRAEKSSYYSIVWCNRDVADRARNILTDRGWKRNCKEAMESSLGVTKTL